ncbi:MAG: hypothetical protein NTZ59_15205, partial [Bacteroidetes bacterium]|nr:hypothetical protein [Bacteroidota bacterium]
MKLVVSAVVVDCLKQCNKSIEATSFVELEKETNYICTNFRIMGLVYADIILINGEDLILAKRHYIG